MYDANEKMSALSEGMRLIERIKDEIAGMGYIGLENDLVDLMADFDLERRDLQDAVLDEYRQQEEEQEDKSKNNGFSFGGFPNISFVNLSDLQEGMPGRKKVKKP